MTERLTMLLLPSATLAAYQLGLWLYRLAGGRIWLHPLVISSVLLALGLRLAELDYARYHSANQLFYLLLGPATVALAFPLHRELHRLKGLVLPILLTVVLGAALASLVAVGLAALAGGEPALLLALSPKSVTTPIALGLAERLGAHASLTTGAVVVTGVVTALLSPLVFRLTGLRDPRAQGLVLGLNGHGAGTARGFELSPVAGAFASLAMGLTGAVTALALPYVVAHWPG